MAIHVTAVMSGFDSRSANAHSRAPTPFMGLIGPVSSLFGRITLGHAVGNSIILSGHSLDAGIFRRPPHDHGSYMDSPFRRYRLGEVRKAR